MSTDIPSSTDAAPSRRSARARLRERLARVAHDGPIMAPGAFDGLSARLVEQAGFEAVYLSGFAVSASLLGQPDVGLLSGSEMADSARRMVAAVAQAKQSLSTLRRQARRATQHSMKFLRWLRAAIRYQLAEAPAVLRLKALYATL